MTSSMCRCWFYISLSYHCIISVCRQEAVTFFPTCTFDGRYGWALPSSSSYLNMSTRPYRKEMQGPKSIPSLPLYRPLLIYLPFQSFRENGWKHGSMDGQTDRRTDGQTDTLAERQTDRQTDEQTDGRTDEQTDRQTDEQTDRRTDGTWFDIIIILLLSLYKRQKGADNGLPNCNCVLPLSIIATYTLLCLSTSKKLMITLSVGLTNILTRRM